jgi:hypothetical protein
VETRENDDSTGASGMAECLDSGVVKTAVGAYSVGFFAASQGEQQEAPTSTQLKRGAHVVIETSDGEGKRPRAEASAAEAAVDEGTAAALSGLNVNVYSQVRYYFPLDHCDETIPAASPLVQRNRCVVSAGCVGAGYNGASQHGNSSARCQATQEARGENEG